MSTILKALRQLEDDKAEADRDLMEQVVEPVANHPSQRRDRRQLWVGGALGLAGAVLLGIVFVPMLQRGADPVATTSGAEGAVLPAPAARAPTTVAAQPSRSAAEAPDPAPVDRPSRIPVVALPVAAEVRAAPAPTGTAARRGGVAATPNAGVTEVAAPEASREKVVEVVAAETLAANPTPAARPALSSPPRQPPAAAAIAEARVEEVDENTAAAPRMARPQAESTAVVEVPEPPRAYRRIAPSPAELVAPPVLVSGTVWHPRRDRREAELLGDDGAAINVREGDEVLDYEVVEITPSAVVFSRDGLTVKRRIGDR